MLVSYSIHVCNSLSQETNIDRQHTTNIDVYYITGSPYLWQQGPQSQKMVIFGAIFLLMTLLILYSSNSGNDISPLYSPFRASTPHHAIKVTDLKKWAGKEGYVAVYGNKVTHTQGWNYREILWNLYLIL